jgi:hypothetical protein
LRHHWAVVPDPIGAELVTAPWRQLHEAATAGQLRGDCDDAATLAGCILSAMEWPARFIAIRERGRPEFSHVFVRCPLYEWAAPSFPAFQLDIDPIVPAAALPLQGDFETLELSV